MKRKKRKIRRQEWNVKGDERNKGREKEERYKEQERQRERKR